MNRGTESKVRDEMRPHRQTMDEAFSLIDAANYLTDLGGLVWFDSSSRGGQQSDADGTCRWSFLSADPIERFVATVDQSDAWQRWQTVVRDWTRRSHLETDERLAVPFTGGWAGVIGYEAGSLLERTGVATHVGLADTIFDLGLYDWVLACDHATGETELIVPAWSRRRCPNRVTQVQKWMAEIAQQPIAPDPPSNQPVTHQSVATSNFSSVEFQAAVGDIVRRIRRGDSFQVNLAQTLWDQTTASPMRLYRRLRRRNPAPMSGYYDAESYQVLCSSPEGFLRLRDRDVETRPIKGTVKRTGDAVVDQQLAERLTQSEKDRAENIMIVDLMRNDLSRVCEPTSVTVPVLCQIERYQFVQHLVSVVQGRLRASCDVVDLLMAAFPGGSITGAPKIEAMRTIAELEPHQRGPYCGSMGYIDANGDSEWNICIRTMIHRDGDLQIPVGGGMTARSDPAAEEAETWIKAEGMLRALLPFR